MYFNKVNSILKVLKRKRKRKEKRNYVCNIQLQYIY